MCDALQQIQGKEDTQNLIKRMLSTETDPKRKANLENALDGLSK